MITRYLYKPDAVRGEHALQRQPAPPHLRGGRGGRARRARSRRATYEEHSIDWSPDGREIAFVSNREPDPDLFYNPDLFAFAWPTASVRRLTATESAEYQPRWSPDGTQPRLPGHAPRPHRPRDHDGGHPRLGDERRRQRPPRAGRGRRQPPGIAHVVCRTAAPSTSRSRSAATCASTGFPRAGGGRRSWSPTRPRGESSASARSGALAYVLHESRATSASSTCAREAGRSRAPAAPTSTPVAAARRRESRKVEPFTFVSNDFKFEVEAFLDAARRARRRTRSTR